ncbi:hypothetical protein Enr13x_30690 [Stieleria neptunia]|uniref:Uncharacterized protein n=1 Tax=Stieleria neptunia TaxID=2527979 RepID=A0A518HQT9_9BACT|nr:hypothetical protein Enr13x_30690 [Stieleria neptunia]
MLCIISRRIEQWQKNQGQENVASSLHACGLRGEGDKKMDDKKIGQGSSMM